MTLIPAPICRGPGWGLDRPVDLGPAVFLLLVILLIRRFNFIYTRALRYLIYIYTLSIPLNLPLSFEKESRVALERALPEQGGVAGEHGIVLRE